MPKKEDKRVGLLELKRLIKAAAKYEEQFEPKHVDDSEIHFTRSTQLRHALKCVKTALNIPRGGI